MAVGQYNISVLNVVITVPESHVGGAERAGLRFGNALAAHIDVDTVMMEGEGDAELFNDLGLSEPVYPIPAYTFLRDGLNQIISSSKEIWNPLIATRLDPPKPLAEYDLVHIHNSLPLAALVSVSLQCKLHSIPYSITMHGISKIPEIPSEIGLSRLQTIVFRAVLLNTYKKVLQQASHLFALSKSDKKTAKEWFPTQSVSVLPNGVEPNPVQQDHQKSDDKLKQTTNKPRLLFVGKLMASKGVDDLLDAIQLLEYNCILTIVGPVRDEQYLQRIEDAGKDVEYKGYVDQDTLNELYYDSDIFVFPTRSDVFPLVTLEAMAAGTPVISTTVGGLPEQIPESVGILVPPREPESLADAIGRLLSDNQLRNQMSKEGLELVDNKYSWDAISKKAVTNYHEILNQKK